MILKNGENMDKEHVVVRERLAVLQSGRVDVPRPLERLSKIELERKQYISKVMTFVLKYLTGKFVDCGFEWMLPVILSKSTDPLWPDPGASLEKRIEVEIYGESVRPTLSMIVHKMVACSLVHSKLFTLSPNLRIERRERKNSGLHAYEFTQLDFEVRNATSREIMSFVEILVCGLIRSLKESMKEELAFLRRNNALNVPEVPFRIYDLIEVEDKYGKNWETSLCLEVEKPVWITNIPREFYDYENFHDEKWDNYDLLLPKFGEVLSGAKREWEYSKMTKKMERDQIKKENYKVLLKLARDKRIKPSAGAGLGIERFISWIVGAKHIGETQPFPKIPGVVYDL